MSRDAALGARAVPIPLTPIRSGVLQERTRWIPTALGVAEDVLLTIGVVSCIPVVILAIGIPIALVVRLLLWIAGAV
jgi:hypothetical protein